MNLWAEIMDQLQLTPQTKPRAYKRPIRSAYCGDLLSDVLAHANPSDLWITIHRHRNIVAVAALVKLSGIIITGGRTPDPDTIETAEREGIPLFTTPLDNFRAAGKIYAILSDYFLNQK